ncbi:adenosine deaminase [Serratia proteamaculans]|jgi:adenosine deaminase|uniref:adenosine deaminase n=1 Tax=Serratia proteamaculans TaxID=28151 RepID=UPI0039AF7CC6
MDCSEIRKLDKGELHVHLNGLVSTSVIKKLLEKTDDKILNQCDLETDLNIIRPAGSLVEYLKPWNLLRLVPISRFDLKLIVESAFLNLLEDNIKFVELRNSVIYIALLNNISVTDALEWVLTEIEVCSNKFNIQAGLILTVTRGEYASEHLRSLLSAYKNLGCPKAVIGLDLAGNEDIEPPRDTAKLFREAKDSYGLGITIHAGETGNYTNIKDAVINYGADRIGHGTAVVKSHEIIDLIIDRNICIEVCPISNRLTKAVPELEPHPVNEMIKYNVPFVLCSDNPAIHASSLSEDYLVFMRETNNKKNIHEMYKTQKTYTFLEGLK